MGGPNWRIGTSRRLPSNCRASEGGDAPGHPNGGSFAVFSVVSPQLDSEMRWIQWEEPR